MEDWRYLLRNSLSNPERMADVLGLNALETADVCRIYPARINPYYLNLLKKHGKCLVRQVVPDIAEISGQNQACHEDPLMEDAFSPVPNLTHRYPDRVLLLVSDQCPVFCRFCTRKRKVGSSLEVTPDSVKKGLAYIQDHREVRDVLLSGGDPLLLEDTDLADILRKLRRIDHVEIIRIGTRVLSTLPQRIDDSLAEMLSAFHPLFIHAHYNHPAEITPESTEACSILADAGIPISSQTVLLSGINDDADILEELFRSLLSLRVRPYYLFQSDMVRGAEQFRTPLETGLRIIETLRSRTSEMALPKFAVDLPKGKGKMIISPHNLKPLGNGRHSITISSGEQIVYVDPV